MAAMCKFQERTPWGVSCCYLDLKNYPGRFNMYFHMNRDKYNEFLRLLEPEMTKTNMNSHYVLPLIRNQLLIFKNNIIYNENILI